MNVLLGQRAVTGTGVSRMRVVPERLPPAALPAAPGEGARDEGAPAPETVAAAMRFRFSAEDLMAREPARARARLEAHRAESALL